MDKHIRPVVTESAILVNPLGNILWSINRQGLTLNEWTRRSGVRFLMGWVLNEDPTKYQAGSS